MEYRSYRNADSGSTSDLCLCGQLYAGVVLTAAEMHAEDRFSFVIVEEQNLLSGNLEDVTIEGTADILRKLKEREENG